MAKIVYVCVRNRELIPALHKRISAIIKNILPDHIVNAECKLISEEDIIYGISNYNSLIKEEGISVCMGELNSNQTNSWNKISCKVDGSYALFRNDKNCVQIVSDVVASRTIWYYFDENLFIASTSQRAIVSLTGKFELDKRVIPWMLSSGTLGPSYSWSKHINRLMPDSSLLLNKSSWSINIESIQPKFIEEKKKSKLHFTQLNDILNNVFNSFSLDLSKWALPLSGGFDSRAIACFLKKGKISSDKITAITWGLKDSINQKDTDAFVAKKIAAELHLNHTYYETDLASNSIEVVFDRYIKSSEGRIDHISGYADGLAIWKKLFDSNIKGIIRGDEGFGWHAVVSDSNVRYSVGLVMCSDFANLEDYESYGFLKQDIPPYLTKNKIETKEQWRDRLYHQYRIPIVLAALSDIKLSYVEIVNPLLTHEIIRQVQKMPDELRTEKKLFKKIVKSISPNLEYAKKGSIASVEDINKTPEALQLIISELNSPYLKEVFPQLFINKIIKKINQPHKKSNKKNLLKRWAKNFFPMFIKDAFRNNISKPYIDYHKIAFRMYLTGKTYKMLVEDSKSQ